tara:strand:+ start:155 stop:463 length:309 start_codon:yes stop_codon:yes gene_type:complete
MKINNYTDLPVVINGQPVSSEQVVLNNEIRKPFVTHNGYEFLSNHNAESRNVEYFIISDGATGYKYMQENYDFPDVVLFISIFFAFWGFHMILRIIQKIKTS